MGKKSRDKGKRGERAAAKWWRDSLGLPGVHRTQQYKGGGDSSDITGTLKFHTEVKVANVTPNVYNAVAQCTDDCPANRFPLVQLKRDREQWLFVMPEETFIHVMLRYMLNA
jgi:hypothetical protein